MPSVCVDNPFRPVILTLSGAERGRTCFSLLLVLALYIAHNPILYESLHLRTQNMYRTARRLGISITILIASASAQVTGHVTIDPNERMTVPADSIPTTTTPGQAQIFSGKQALAAKQFIDAKTIFTAALAAHPDSVEAKLGLADSELGLQQYETAEIEYRQVVAAQPTLWQAHKNLVIVEAALNRWDEFDGERNLLRMARERNAPGISARESDVIDGFTVHGKRWIVREYFQPVGRSQTRYNFEHFSPDGKAQVYLSLESEDAAKALTAGGAVAIGDLSSQPAANPTFALNWYTGKAHGTITSYGQHEPTYEQVRGAVLRWLRR